MTKIRGARYESLQSYLRVERLIVLTTKSYPEGLQQNTPSLRGVLRNVLVFSGAGYPVSRGT
jgi:hypothetical protein